MKEKINFLIRIFFIIFFSSSACLGQDFFLSNQEKKYLLNISRQTLYYYLNDGTVPKPDESTLAENLNKKRDCFVTLYKRGNVLRGCIGFGGQQTLYGNVIDMTIAAATKDSRFYKVQYDELKDIKIEISVLTEPKEVHFISPGDLLNKIESGVDGIFLRTRYGGSTYIPKVWETIPDKEEFISTLCMKHGAPSDTWLKDYKNIRVWKFQAICFGEEIYGRKVIGKGGAVVGKNGAYLLGSVDPNPQGAYLGGYKVNEGTELAPGTIVSPDSEIIDH